MSKIFFEQQTQEDNNEVDPIVENIQTVAELHKRAQDKVSPQQRKIEALTDFLGRPRFLYIILMMVFGWLIVNTLLTAFDLPSIDPPPFVWLQGVLTLAALLQTTLILISQKRQDIMSDRRTQLDLQVSLILDQKMSKLLTMVDQLRRVHPEIEDSTDPEVEALKKTVDPHESVKTLNQLLEEEE